MDVFSRHDLRKNDARLHESMAFVFGTSELSTLVQHTQDKPIRNIRKGIFLVDAGVYSQ